MSMTSIYTEAVMSELRKNPEINSIPFGELSKEVEKVCALFVQESEELVGMSDERLRAFAQEIAPTISGTLAENLINTNKVTEADTSQRSIGDLAKKHRLIGNHALDNSSGLARAEAAKKVRLVK